MKLDIQALPFDQYQRYRLVSDLIDEVRTKKERFTILDVGGRTGLLRAFLPTDDVALVDLEPSDVKGLVLGDGSRLPYKDKCFDIVATFDTLEHVPPPRRAAFVAECARVAKRWVFIAGPYQSPEVEEAERILQRFLLDKLEVEHRYLEEHRHNGLPSLPETEAGLKAGGAEVAHIGHGNLERWLALMCMAMYLDYEPRLRPLAARVFRFYNAHLYESDHAAPVYRHAVVGALAGARLPKGHITTTPPVAPRGTLTQFREVADELVSFDRARTDWREERARLAEILATLEGDLAGHRSTLEDVKARRKEQDAVIATLREDLAGHRETLASARAELESEREASRRMRNELEAELAAHQSEEAHLLAELETERTVNATAREELVADLERHRALKTELENLVEQRDAVLAALESDLDGHRRSLAATQAITEEQRAVIEDQQRALADLARHQSELEDSLSDRENRIAALTDIRGALERELAAHRTALTEIEADLVGHKRTLKAREAELEDYRRSQKSLEAELARHQREHAQAAAQWSERLEEHVRVQAAIASDLGEHKKVLADVSADLDGHRRLAVDLRAEIESARREQARLQDELNRAQQEIAAKSSEITAAARALAENDALIGALRGDLKNRWKSIKRGLGPRRPTPGETRQP